MPTTSEAQRAELHKTIWSIADDLRGSVDGWDFKQYVLGMLFYRFISENLTEYLNLSEGDGFNYEQLSDADADRIRNSDYCKSLTGRPVRRSDITFQELRFKN